MKHNILNILDRKITISANHDTITSGWRYAVEGRGPCYIINSVFNTTMEDFIFDELRALCDNEYEPWRGPGLRFKP